MLNDVLLKVRMLRRRQKVGRTDWLLELRTAVVDHLRACVHDGCRLLYMKEPKNKETNGIAVPASMTEMSQ